MCSGLLARLALVVIGLGQDTLGQDTLGQELPGGRRLDGSRASIRFVAADSGKAVRVLRALEGFTPLPGLPADGPTGVVLLLAPDEETFNRLTRGQTPDWGAAVAIPALSTIVIPSYASARGPGWSDVRVLRHVWSHIGLHPYLVGLRVPRWFSEGYAQWASGGRDWK